MEDQLCGRPQWCDPPRESQDHISPQQLAKELLLLEVLADGGGGEVSSTCKEVRVTIRHFFEN